MARFEVKDTAPEMIETTVHINRVAKTVKGGRRARFAALMVVGDGKGNVGFGIGKAAEVPEAIRKGIEAAKKDMVSVPILNTTVPHEIVGEFASGKVLLKLENVTTDKIKDISLEVRAGELVALYGMAGSGQDHILETIFGVGNQKMTGTIWLDGEKLEINSPKEAIAKGMGYIPAERKTEGIKISLYNSAVIVLRFALRAV